MTPTTPQRGFDPTEFESRVERAQALMAEQSIDLLLLTTEPEFRYYTGFLTQFWLSPTRPWYLLVPAAGVPVAVVPEIGVPVLERTWIDEIRSWPAPTPHDEGVSLLVSEIESLGAARGRIGVPMGPETSVRMPLSDWTRLLVTLPAADVVDASPIIRAQRMVKSEREITKISHICRVASAAFDRVPHFAERGMPLDEAFRAFKIALLEAGADDVPYLVGAAEADGYGDVISPPSGRPLVDGDVLMMDTGAVWDGYFCDFDRNFAIGHASDPSRRAYDTLYRATEAALAVAVPGASSTDLYRAMQSVIVDAGYDAGNVGRFGHGLGMQLTEWPSHTATDNTIIEAEMVLTLEPSMEFAPGKGMVHEENLVVRSDGPELLSRRAPAELPVI